LEELAMLRSVALVPVALCALAARRAAQSTDYHVDVVSGSDATGNGTLAAPWKTITHALNATSGYRRVRAAAGEYSSASGESFPLSLPPEATLVGAGRGATILRGTNAQVMLMPGNASGLEAYHPLVESLTFAGPATAILATGPSNPLGVVDVEFECFQCVWVLEDGLSASLAIQRSHFHDCTVAVYLQGFGYPTAILDQCVVENSTVAFQINTQSGPAWTTGYSTVYANSSVVRGNFRVVQMNNSPNQHAELRLTGSLVTGNALIGVTIAAVDVIGTFCLIESYWSTLADNGGLVTASPLATTLLKLWGSILWNSGTSVDPDMSVDAWRSNTDLPITGSLVTHLDPLFDPLAPGQYRLSPTSPLVDMYANYGYPQPTTDFEGDPRALDGDGVAFVDLGWDERTNLLLLASAPAQLGTTVQLTTHATAPIPVAAFLSPATATLQLDAGNYVLIQLATAVFLGAGVAPSTKSVSAPADPALSGLRVWAQSGGLSGAQILTSNRIEFALY
jgi:hypothetical protein